MTKPKLERANALAVAAMKRVSNEIKAIYGEYPSMLLVCGCPGKELLMLNFTDTLDEHRQLLDAAVTDYAKELHEQGLCDCPRDNETLQ